MTTGEPLIVRGAMKPLPTLTKPLRSVDIATQRAGPGAARAHRLVGVPAAGVVGEAMVAFVLADAYRRKFGGDHIDDVREAVPRLRGADRVAAVATATARSSSSASWARASRPPRARSAAALGVRAARHRRAGRGAARLPVAEVFDRSARRRSASARSASCASCSSAPDGRRRSRSAAARSSPSARAPRSRATSPCSSTSTPRRRGRGQPGGGRPLARDRAALRRAARRARAPLYEAPADAILPRARARHRAPRAAVRCSRCAAGDAAAVGDGALGRATPCSSGAACWSAAVAARGRRFSSPTRTSPRAARGAAAGSAAPSTIPPGEEHKTLATAERVLARARRARAMTRADHVVALGGGVVGDLAGLLRRDLPARRPGRPGPDDARRPGRLGLRRQDRRRPARGQELRRRLPPARGRARRPATLETLPAAGAARRAGPRSSRPR